MSVNKVKERNLAVLVNPISGKKKGRGYFRDILQPMLRIVGMEYEMFETTSATYVQEWVNSYSSSTFHYTDII